MILLYSDLSMNEISNIGIICGIVLILMSLIFKIISKNLQEKKEMYIVPIVLGVIVLICGFITKG